MQGEDSHDLDFGHCMDAHLYNSRYAAHASLGQRSGVSDADVCLVGRGNESAGVLGPLGGILQRAADSLLAPIKLDVLSYHWN
jgi:hypothetical protein